MLPRGTFVLGGAASGKSAWAENLLENSGLSLTYLATAEVLDGEMGQRVARHRARRDARWRTVECPRDPAPVLEGFAPGQAVLIDCATLWLSNQMMAEADLGEARARLIAALRATAARWVIVSNEVGQGIVPQNALSREFREAQGRLNIALAAEADLAVQVVAGLPQVLKGALP